VSKHVIIEGAQTSPNAVPALSASSKSFRPAGIAVRRWRVRVLSVIALAVLLGGVSTVPVLHAAQAASGAAWMGLTAGSAATGIAGQLNGVTATSASDAWAVGDYWSGKTGTAPVTLILHWNGTRWSRVASPSPVSGDELSGVSATSSANAWAVGGSAGVPLILHWNGTRWSQVASPTAGTWPTTLVAVSATSASNAWAVGYWFDNGLDKTFTVHWNGTKWSRVTSPNPGPSENSDVLNAVKATSGTNAWAVGETGAGSLILHWNGTSWSKVTTANYEDLYGVGGVSANNAWTVSQWYKKSIHSFRTLIVHWNGTSWSKVATPSVTAAQYNVLTAVSAVSATNAWAVGAYGLAGNCYDFTDCHTLTLHWNGRTWSKVASPNPPSSNSQLYAVAVTSGSNAWAVGGYCNTTTCATLMLHWNGTSWSIT
jgi:hypothetical protein